MPLKIKKNKDIKNNKIKMKGRVLLLVKTLVIKI